MAGIWIMSARMATAQPTSEPAMNAMRTIAGLRTGLR